MLIIINILLMRTKSVLFVFMAMVLQGCFNSEKVKQRAVEMINRGEADCVMVCANGEMIIEQGRGLSPLLSIYEQHPGAMHGAIVVDKVIGRAAAMILIEGKAVKVHGILMSEDAYELLWRNCRTSYGELVPRILNPQRDGLCPLEQAVEGIDSPKQAIEAIKQRISELSAEAQ